MGLDMYIERIHDNYFSIRKKLNELNKEYEEIKNEVLKYFKENGYPEEIIQFKNYLNEKLSAKITVKEIILKILNSIDYKDLDGSIEFYFFVLNPVSFDIDIGNSYKEEIKSKVKKLIDLIPEKYRNELIVLSKRAHEFIEKEDEWHPQELIYWRKANQIHGWFVRNVQDGVDNCDYYEVSKEKLERLLKTINEVLKSKDVKLAEELLPPTEGFFFGSIEIDEYYWDTLEYTKKKIENLVKNYENLVGNGWKIYYVSSW